MIAKSAKTVAEFRVMVDELGNLIDKMLKTDNDRDLSQSEAELFTAFRGLQYNVYILYGETKRQLDSHRANIRSGKDVDTEAIGLMKQTTTIDQKEGNIDGRARKNKESKLKKGDDLQTGHKVDTGEEK